MLFGSWNCLVWYLSDALSIISEHKWAFINIISPAESPSPSEGHVGEQKCELPFFPLLVCQITFSQTPLPAASDCKVLLPEIEHTHHAILKENSSSYYCCLNINLKLTFALLLFHVFSPMGFWETQRHNSWNVKYFSVRFLFPKLWRKIIPHKRCGSE